MSSSELSMIYTRLRQIAAQLHSFPSTLPQVVEQRTVAQSLLTTILNVPYKNIYVRDICALYDAPSKRAKNDANNALRESILANIPELPSYFFEAEEYGPKWTAFRTALYDVLRSFSADPFVIEHKGGRAFNHDYEVHYSNNGAITRTVKLEFKHNTKQIERMPQFLSLYERFGLMPASYTSWFYTDVLPSVVAALPDFPHAIPDKETYMRCVYNSNHDAHPFFRALYDRRTPATDAIVNRSIASYLATHGPSIDIAKFTQKAKESQGDKVFLLWDRSAFHVQSFDTTIFDGLRFVRIKNNNTVVLANDRAEFHLLLRWRNGKGCNLPAWQIGYVPLAA